MTRRGWTALGAIAAGSVAASIIWTELNPPTPPPPPPPPPKAEPARTSIDQIAAQVASGYGKVPRASNAGSRGSVIVFEEMHTSRVGQIEISAMLYRLYKGYELRHIALEGALASDGVLQASWFHSLSNTPEGSSVGRDVAGRLLLEGEISDAEFVALVSPDVVVHGIERGEEYGVEDSEEAEASKAYYFVATAERSLTQEQRDSYQSLLEEGKKDEAREFLIDANPSNRAIFSVLRSPDTPIEEDIKVLEELNQRAVELGVSIPEKTRSDFEALQHFYEVASQRSDTMVRNTIDLLSESPSAAVALIIGAAHTEKVVRLLESASVSFAVLTPGSFSEQSAEGDLTEEEANRKVRGRSVDGPGLLGAILNAPRKPPPVIGREWLQDKAETYYITIERAHAAAGGSGGGPPPPEGGHGHPHFSDQCYYEEQDNEGHKEVVFCGSFGDLLIWVRAVERDALISRTVDELLLAERKELKQASQSAQTRPRILELAPGLLAVYSIDEQLVRSTPLSGN